MINSNTSKKGGMTVTFPILVTVFIVFVIIGMALPVLPLQVHNNLGFNTFVVGVVAGVQFAASLISRLWAGRLADVRGAKFAVKLGLYLALTGGFLYTVSCFVTQLPILSVSVLLAGRAFLGGAESLVITGSILWGLQLVSDNHSAKVLAWVGMAMFAALAVGAPIGSLFFDAWGFLGIALATIVLSVVSLVFIQRGQNVVPVASSEKASTFKVFKQILLPGMSFALSGITFGAVTTFLTLYFSVKHWDYGALSFAVFAATLIVTRFFFGNLPDKYGGAKVSLYCLVIQVAGMFILAAATTEWVAIMGAAAAGVGFSLVFPGLGLEAIKRTPVENRGLAMGLYNAFLDITMGVGSPALGLLAEKHGIESVFMLSAVAAIIAIPLTVALMGVLPAIAARFMRK